MAIKGRSRQSGTCGRKEGSDESRFSIAVRQDRRVPCKCIPHPLLCPNFSCAIRQSCNADRGVQGYGHIGREAARLLKSFNVKIIAANSSGQQKADEGVSSTSWTDKLATEELM